MNDLQHDAEPGNVRWATPTEQYANRRPARRRKAKQSDTKNVRTRPPVQPLLVRPRDAASVLGVSLRHLDQLVKDGVIRPVRLTPKGHRRFRTADLHRLATEKERP